MSQDSLLSEFDRLARRARELRRLIDMAPENEWRRYIDEYCTVIHRLSEIMIVCGQELLITNLA